MDTLLEITTNYAQTFTVSMSCLDNEARLIYQPFVIDFPSTHCTVLVIVIAARLRKLFVLYHVV